MEFCRVTLILFLRIPCLLHDASSANASTPTFTFFPSVFAEYGHLSHGALCDAVMTTLTRHIDKEIVIMRALHAIGKLGEFNAENKVALQCSCTLN